MHVWDDPASDAFVSRGTPDMTIAMLSSEFFESASPLLLLKFVCRPLRTVVT